MCEMIFEVQGKTDKYVRLERDWGGIEFLGKRERILLNGLHKIPK